MNVQAFSCSSKPGVRLENVSRRKFIRSTAVVAAFAVAAEISGLARAVAYETGGAQMPHGTVNDPHVFVSIDSAGIVSIIAHRSEMGTGIRTSLPMVVADELEADWSKVRIVQALADEPRYGNQDTDGSRSMRHFLQPMRQVGAAMRQMLEQAAAKQWAVPLSEVQAANHEVVHRPTGRRLAYGELAKAAMDLPTPQPESLKFKPDNAFRYMGHGNVPIFDLFDITVGKAQYGYDVRLPGMRYAVVARPPVVGGKIKSFDATDALKVPGVEKVMELRVGWAPPAAFSPLGGIAVVATNTWAAIKGREALKVDWEDGENGTYDSVAYRQQMAKAASNPGRVERTQGDFDKAFAGASKVVSAEYYVPHLAQASMEPLVATATIRNGECEVWAPLQYPFGAREAFAKLLELPIDKVKVNVTLLGGGFGRKCQSDFAQEAVLLSKALDGAPVKLAWTREDDLHHGFYHTVTYSRLDAGIDSSGKVTAWRHRSVAPTLFANFKPDPKREQAIELGLGLADVALDIRNVRVETGEAAALTRIGWFRSVNNIPHAFAVQSFIGEIAQALGKDPKDFLLEIIGPPRKLELEKLGLTDPLWNYGDPYSTYPVDTGRLANVVNLAASRASWGRSLPKGSGLGIAAHRSFLSYVATVVEVRVDSQGKLIIPRVETAIDCGFAVNPERIRSQIEGAAVMGLSNFIGEISFKNGRAEQGNFDNYPVARIDNAPINVRVHIVSNGSDVPAGGVGEPGVPPFLPALCNAIFAATGKRIRSLPAGDQIRV
ncbi:xanthine dehydrogenase family protein molybdopterin-binding subunit [Bradyrhizobium sp. LCT2]|uniref:xanthine dehydrogenase family protein molybdopterin-binding subunit n=1 Tax=Bradyrhizobium sp. LCT2 TaxID=2493093 RepID=UPI0013738027|nr:molybdopterin cofactor-binding domain-containing protein [Bradyrhizobium sp. LCT2]QHP67924.1 xanthine dehydrogenase family protein molybdopterin-binding subunit [Bradyrhizobium sp. LCT2]